MTTAEKVLRDLLKDEQDQLQMLNQFGPDEAIHPSLIQEAKNRTASNIQKIESILADGMTGIVEWWQSLPPERQWELAQG
jgi:hypothetical protein